MPPFRWCGDDEALERYALGRLTAEMEEEFDDHLLLCHACQDRLEQIDSDIATMREMLSQPPPAAWGGVRAWIGELTASLTPRPVWAGAFALLLVAAFLAPRAVRRGEGPADVTLSVVRGVEQNATGPGYAPLRLRADLTELPAHGRYRVEVVRATGGVVWTAEVEREGNQLSASWDGADKGAYWVRLYAPGANGELLREYGLTLR